MFRGQRPEAVDTRWVFRAYAALAGLAGVLLLISGPAWLGAGLPGDSTLIRVFGSLVIAAGCCAGGFAAVDPPDARRRGLFWFAAGHAVFWLALVAQRIVTGASPDTAVHFLWAVVFALFYVWAISEGEQRGAALISLFGAGGARPAEQLRSRYARQVGEAARQEERKRLARDLHDSVKQQIFAIQTAAATAQVRFDQDHAGAREALEQIRASAREAAAEMRAMLDQLQAVPLENAGLIEALKKQSEALGFRTGARVEFRLGELPPADSLSPGAHDAILRAAQEALANVARHARAANVTVSLTSARGAVELNIRDDGAGFDPNRAPRGQGIANMHARAEEFGGKLELLSRPGGGTAVVLSIPYTAVETAREYHRRAVSAAAALLLSIAYLFWMKSLFVAALSAIAAVGAVRYAVAWRRVRVRDEAAR